MISRKAVTAGLTIALAATGLAVSAASPASAADPNIACRTPYTANGWNAKPCVSYPIDSYFARSASGSLNSHPSNCKTWRVFLVNGRTGANVVTTSAWNCGHTYLETPAIVIGDDYPYLYSRIVAYDASGKEILRIQSPSL